MIGRLRGIVAGRTRDGVLLDVGGVGYDVAVTPRTLAVLPPIGEEAVLHVHTHVREDQLALYGFTTEADRELFRLLLGASGVGPKVALAILATFDHAELRQAVATQDVAALTTVPGIGKRSAQKLILELGPKLDAGDVLVVETSSAVADVREALEALGYGPVEIREALAAIGSDVAASGTTEDLLRLALRELGR